MNTQHIPEEILNNPNFDINNKVVVKELDELFEEILLDISIKDTKDYKTLVKEINGRIDSESKLKEQKEIHKNKLQELEMEKEKLRYLLSLK